VCQLLSSIKNEDLSAITLKVRGLVAKLQVFKRIMNCFPIENSVDKAHGPWTETSASLRWSQGRVGRRACWKAYCTVLRGARPHHGCTRIERGRWQSSLRVAQGGGAPEMGWQ
jgi:hypothetical protein